MKIKDYHKFQHFSNRRPPWIKLYREIMDDYDLSVVSDRAFRILIWLWLLASEDELQEGNLPDLDTIAFRLRLSKQHISNALQELDKWVIQDDDNMISDGYQDDTLEKERETETETEESVCYADACERWNKLAKSAGLSTIREISSNRRKHYNARVAENPDFWDVLEREICNLDKFALGDNDRKWKITFDYCVESQDKFNKLAEGNYRQPQQKGSNI